MASADVINRFISATHPRAPLAGQGQMIVNVGERHGVDPRLLAAIARNETEFGTTAGRFTNNPGGWGVHLGPEVNTSRSWEEGFEKIAKGLAGNLYKGSGLTTPQQIFMRYAPPSENNTRQYINQVNSWMRQMGADPNANVFGGSWRQQAGRARAPRQAGVGAAPPPGADAQTPNAPPFDQVTPGTIRPGRVAIAPSTLAMMQRYANESEAAVMQGQSPANADLLGTMLEFDMTPPVFTPGQIIPGQQPRENARVGAVQSPPAAPSPRDRGTVPVGRSQAQPRLTMGGGPDAHHSRALGNWQSDDAYDLMGPAGAKIVSPVAGRVTNISGQPGGSPGFAGYGITVDTRAGQFFFKHLGTKTVKIGDRIKPGQLLGTLDAATAGGPHLHLGGTNAKLLEKLARWYTSGGR